MSGADHPILIVRFNPEMAVEGIKNVLTLLGLTDGMNQHCRLYEGDLLTIKLSSSKKVEKIEKINLLPAVQKAVFLPKHRRLFSRKDDGGCDIVRIDQTIGIGGAKHTIIAGPCSVESRQQICEIAAQVKEAGAHLLRGGAFKPRTSPYSFGGLGEKGLEYLAMAREETGLPIVTEVLDTTDLDLVARYADVLQIGSRNMYNSKLLFKAGSHPSGKPILLKRCFGALIGEFLDVTDYILLGRIHAGNDDPGLVLCERGIRTMKDTLRFTLDIGAIPTIKEKARFPILADPSHAAGRREFVPSLAMSALAAGADGLLIEVHTDPDHAWSDGAQSMSINDFNNLMKEIENI